MSAHRGKADIAPQGRDFRFDPSPTSALEKMEAGRSEPPPPTLSAAPNKSILKTFLFFPAVSNRFHPKTTAVNQAQESIRI
jgi:hypothetical protein